MGNARKLEPRRSRRLTTAERNVVAEARAVEEGHRAFVQSGGWVKVLSDTHGDIGKWFHVEFVTHIDGLISFSCRPEGPKAYRDDHLAASAAPGSVSCKHAALAARRLEREGLATYDGHGRWKVTERVLLLIGSSVSADPSPNPDASRGPGRSTPAGTASATRAKSTAEANDVPPTSSPGNSRTARSPQADNSTTPATTATRNAEADAPARTAAASTSTTSNPSSRSSTPNEDEGTAPRSSAPKGTRTTRPTRTRGDAGSCEVAGPVTENDNGDTALRELAERLALRPIELPSNPLDGLPR